MLRVSFLLLIAPTFFCGTSSYVADMATLTADCSFVEGAGTVYVWVRLTQGSSMDDFPTAGTSFFYQIE